MNVLRGAMILMLAGSHPAAAASNVSAKYDGVYQGAASPAPTMGAAGCPAFILAEISVVKGFLRAPRGEGLPVVSGFITEDGYVSAFLTRAGHQRSALDGRVDEGVIVTGFIEVDSGCVWVIRMHRRP